MANNQNTLLTGSFLSVLLLSSTAVFCSTVPQQQQVDQLDLIMAVPGRGIETIFRTLQTELTNTLHAKPILDRTTARPIGLSNIIIDGTQFNLTTNHMPGKPMQPHISLKGTPLASRQQATMIAQALFADCTDCPLPTSIRLTGLFALRSRDKQGASDKIFIVADFQDNPAGNFGIIADHLDLLTGIPRPAEQPTYLHHITLAKIFPTAKNSSKINDSYVTSIQAILTDLWSRLATLPLLSQEIPIDRIEYTCWNADPARANQVIELWRAGQAPASIIQAPRPAASATTTSYAPQPERQAAASSRIPRPVSAAAALSATQSATTHNRIPRAASSVTPTSYTRQLAPSVTQAAAAAAPVRVTHSPAVTPVARAMESQPIYTYEGGYPTYLSNQYNGPLATRSDGFATLEQAVEHWYQIYQLAGIDKEKEEIMKIEVRKKFEANVELAQKLLATGNAEIINNSGEEAWGGSANKLGKILMEVRDELRR